MDINNAIKRFVEPINYSAQNYVNRSYRVDMDIKTAENMLNHIADLEQRLAAAEAKLPRWIPVSERLPKQNGDYLVSTEHFVAEAEFDACSGEFQEFSIDGWAEVKGVLAWQELPEVYTPERGGVMSDLKAIWVEKKIDSFEPEALRIDFKDDWHVRVKFDSLSKRDIASALYHAGNIIWDRLHDELKTKGNVNESEEE